MRFYLIFLTNYDILLYIETIVLYLKSFLEGSDFMLKETEKLRQVKIYDYTFRENEKGEAIDTLSGKKFIMPSWSTLLSDAYNVIQKAGFSNIKRVRTPEQANCIIRLFQKQHYEYARTCSPIIFSLYGIICYTQNAEGKWLTKSSLSGIGSDEHEIDFSQYSITNFLWQECIQIDVDFFDVYAIVS